MHHIIPIKIEKVEGFNCVDLIINGVCKWKKTDYQLMFLDEWSFNYSKNCPIFSERFRYEDENKYNLLKKYHNIEMTSDEIKNKDEAFDFIKKSVLNNKPVGIVIDNYWVCWNFMSYKKKSASHYLLAVGIDESKDELICVDSQMAVNGQRLDRYHFINGCIEYNSFIFNDESYKENLESILDNIYSNLFKNKMKSNMFQDIRQFAVDFLNDFDYEKELELYKNSPNISPFLKEIVQIGNSRANYARALRYIQEKYNFSKFKNSIDNLNLSYSKWQMFFGMLIKSYYTANIGQVRYKLFNKILEIANLEEQIFDEIKRILETGEVKDIKFENITYNHYKGPINYTEYIDLSQYFNNKGICLENNIFKEAQISNPNRFIIVDKLCANNILQVENMKFDFGYIDRDLDNISCNGQEILINNCNYKYMMILSCSEFADCSEVLQLVHENNEIENLELKSTSWMRRKSQFDEILALYGVGAVRIDDKIDKYPFEVSVFAKCYQLKKQGGIIKIILPIIPNIHIFAITFAN